MHFLIYGGIAVAAGASLPILLGFGTAGIVAGSLAAGFQSSMGTVAAGSVFAVTQSLAAQGIFTYTAIVGGAVAGSGVVYDTVVNKNTTSNSTLKEESNTENEIKSSPE